MNTEDENLGPVKIDWNDPSILRGAAILFIAWLVCSTILFIIKPKAFFKNKN